MLTREAAHSAYCPVELKGTPDHQPDVHSLGRQIDAKHQPVDAGGCTAQKTLVIASAAAFAY